MYGHIKNVFKACGVFRSFGRAGLSGSEGSTLFYSINITDFVWLHLKFCTTAV